MLTRYDPWNPAREPHKEINRVFANSALPNTDDSSNVVTSGWTPAVDIKEDDTAFTLRADIPGVDPADIEVTMDKGVLTIKGDRKSEHTEEGENGYKRVERVYGGFYRRFSLPDTADAQNVSASGKHGVLEVVIPKKVAEQPKRIQVAA